MNVLCIATLAKIKKKNNTLFGKKYNKKTQKRCSFLSFYLHFEFSRKTMFKTTYYTRNATKTSGRRGLSTAALNTYSQHSM